MVQKLEGAMRLKEGFCLIVFVVFNGIYSMSLR